VHERSYGPAAKPMKKYWELMENTRLTTMDKAANTHSSFKSAGTPHSRVQKYKLIATTSSNSFSNKGNCMSTEPNGGGTKKIEIGIGKALPRELEKLAADRNISISKSCEILLDDWLGLDGHPDPAKKK